MTCEKPNTPVSDWLSTDSVTGEACVPAMTENDCGARLVAGWSGSGAEPPVVLIWTAIGSMLVVNPGTSRARPPLTSAITPAGVTWGDPEWMVTVSGYLLSAPRAPRLKTTPAASAELAVVPRLIVR